MLDADEQHVLAVAGRAVARLATAGFLVGGLVTPLWAQDAAIPSVTVGGGARVSLFHTDVDGGDNTTESCSTAFVST